MIIEVNNLSKTYKVKNKGNVIERMFFPTYKEVEAVKDISFTVNKGESVALLGPNGAGKTTTMKMLSGLLYPTKGYIKVFNYFPFDKNHDFLRKIGLVMGNKSGLAWDLTPNQNFELLKKLYSIKESDYTKRVTELCTMLDINNCLDKQIRKLSLGERMKVELVGSILHSPEILFLDEPTIGLDIISKQKIRTFLRDLQKNSDITLILTSHDMDDIEKVSDRVIVINNGQLVIDESMTKLLSRYKDRKYITLILTEKVSRKDISKYGKITDTKDLSYTLEIKSSRQAEMISSIMKNLPVDDIDIVHVPLEEIIADIFAK